MTTTMAAVLAGTREVLLALGSDSLTISADFPAPRLCDTEEAFIRSQPRGLRVLALSDEPILGSGRWTFRHLVMDVGLVYATTLADEVVQGDDAPYFETELAHLQERLADIDQPIAQTDTRPSLIEAGPSFVRTDFEQGTRMLTLFRVSIDYKAR